MNGYAEPVTAITLDDIDRNITVDEAGAGVG